MNIPYIVFEPIVSPAFVLGGLSIGVFVIGAQFVRQRKALYLLAYPDRRTSLFHHYSSLKHYGKTACFMMAVALLGMAFLRPQWDKKELPLEHKGRDIVVALDISRSMLAEDCKPNRLVCAQKKIKEIAYRLMRNDDSHDRLCLLIFSGAAVVQCPFTHDIEAFLMFLNEIDTDTLSSGTTALDGALQKALDLFKDQPSAKDRLLIVVTDGEDFSNDLTLIKEQAQKEKVKTFVLGVGTLKGAPVPCFDEGNKRIGHQKDKNGAVVISSLNESLISGLAQFLGGRYVRMTEDKKDVAEVHEWVNQFEKQTLDSQTRQTFEDKYYLATALSLGLLVLEWLL